MSLVNYQGLTRLPLLACIYAIDLQELEDVAVWRNIAKDTSWVRDRVKAFAIVCALGFRREFDPKGEIAIRFDPRGHRGLFFLPFLPGLISVILLRYIDFLFPGTPQVLYCVVQLYTFSFCY